jgi:hypothetical protein
MILDVASLLALAELSAALKRGARDADLIVHTESRFNTAKTGSSVW